MSQDSNTSDAPGPSEPKRVKTEPNNDFGDASFEDASDDALHSDEPDFATDDDAEFDEQRLTENAVSDLISAVESGSLWTNDYVLQFIPFRQCNEFKANPEGTPISYFNFFFEEEFLAMICESTNAEAVKLMCADTVMEKSRITGWKDLSVPELKVFLGLLFHMGFIQLPHLQDYWKIHRLFAIPVFGQHMSRNRFLLIMRCLNFSSDTEIDGSDPFNKVRSVIDYFNYKMDTCYYPSKELNFDECMVLWRGRLRLKQCIKNRLNKSGICLYTLTEPDGLILKLGLSAESEESDDSSKGHTEELVLQLIEKYLLHGHSIYMGKSYLSFNFAKRLLDHDTYCTGFLRNNSKDNPVEVVQKALRKTENISRFRDGVHIGKWKDKSTVLYISTEHGGGMVAVPNKRGKLYEKPVALVKYNEFMADIERQDQIFAFYPCERKTFRWQLKLAIHTFHLLFINSYKMYNKYSGQPNISQYNYRLSVISELLTEKNSSTDANTKTSNKYKIYKENKKIAQHKITKITVKNAKGIVKRKMCRLCLKKNKKRKDTTWYCATCPDEPGLCVECFTDYHKTIEVL